MFKLAFIISIFFWCNAYADDLPKDMVTLCSVDVNELNDVHHFPRWTPKPGSALFISFDNLTSHGGEAHQDCQRLTSITGNHLENKGDNCDFSATEAPNDPIFWNLYLNNPVQGTIETFNGVELTYFKSGSAPKFDGGTFFAGDLTRLCRRKINGKLTDEIILEVQHQKGKWYDYIIVDEYPSNI